MDAEEDLLGDIQSVLLVANEAKSNPVNLFTILIKEELECPVLAGQELLYLPEVFGVRGVAMHSASSHFDGKRPSFIQSIQVRT